MASYIPLPVYLASVAQRYRLEAQHHPRTGAWVFPPRPEYQDRTGWEVARLSGRGRVHTFTTVARGTGPAEFDAEQEVVRDLVVALVELEEGPRIMAQLRDTDPGEVAIGAPVRAVLRRLYDQEGVVRYGFAFVLTNERS